MPNIFCVLRHIFIRRIHSEGIIAIFEMLIKAYLMFLQQPETVGFSHDMINMNAIDTDPRKWEVELVTSSSGDDIILCFMPIINDALDARIFAVIFNDNGDGYYYCMLNHNHEVPSKITCRKEAVGMAEIGEVIGTGYKLRNSFLNCIQNDFYK